MAIKCNVDFSRWVWKDILEYYIFYIHHKSNNVQLMTFFVFETVSGGFFWWIFWSKIYNLQSLDKSWFGLFSRILFNLRRLSFKCVRMSSTSFSSISQTLQSFCRLVTSINDINFYQKFYLKDFSYKIARCFCSISYVGNKQFFYVFHNKHHNVYILIF